MKKLAYIFISLLAALIFLINYENTNFTQYITLANLQYTEMSVLSNENAIYVNLNEKANGENSEVVNSYINELAKEYKIIGAYSYTGNGLRKITTYFVPDNFDSILGNVYTSNDSIKSILAENGYVTTNHDDSKADGIIDLLSPSYNKKYNNTIEIHNMDTIAKYNNGELANIQLTFISENKTKLINDIKNSKLIGFIQDGWEDRTYHFELPENDMTLTKIMFLISLVSFLLILFCQLSKCRKNIMIMKLSGFSTFEIEKELCIKQLINQLLLYITTLAVMYLLFIHKLTYATHDFLSLLIVTILFDLICLIMIGVIIYLIIANVNKVINMSITNLNHNLVKLSFLLKLFFIFIVIIPLFDFVNNGMPAISKMYYMIEEQEKYRNYLFIEGIRFESFDRIQDNVKSIYQIFNKNGAIYQEFELNYDYEKQSNSYEIYPKDFLIANQNFLNQYTIKGESGEIIDIKDNTLLVPAKYKDENIDSSVYCNEDCSILYIENDVKLYNHDVKSETPMKKNAIIYVPGKEYENYLLFKSNLYIKDDSSRIALESALNEYNIYFNKDISIGKTNVDYDILYQSVFSQILSLLISLAIYCFVLFVFIYQNVFILFLENKKEFATKLLNGYGYIELYGSFLIFNLLTTMLPIYFACYIYAIPFKELLPLIFCIIFFELCESYFLIRKFEKVNVLSVLKGDD